MARASNAVVDAHPLDAAEFGLPRAVNVSAILDEVGVPVCVEDMRERRFLYANRAFRSAFGTGERGDSYVEHERAFVNSPSEQLARSARLHSSEGDAQGEFHHTATRRWYRVGMRQAVWGDGRRARVYTWQDATDAVERKRRDTEERERLLMTSRLMSVGELVTTLAHELNQPLGAIANYLGGAVRRLRAAADRPAEDVLAAIDRAHLQAEHAARIVSRMREFVRTREPRLEPVKLAEVVSAVLELLELPAQQSGVRITIDLPEDLPGAIADRVMIEQVVLNLTKNALEAMHEVPREERALRISARTDLDGCIELSVSDTGPGISGAAREQLYSPFVTTKPDGMGMGLNICRSIVEYHRGRLFCTGHGKRGTTFCVTLPQSVAEAA